MWSVEYLPQRPTKKRRCLSICRRGWPAWPTRSGSTDFSHLPRDWVKPLGGKLWELRITGKDGIARAIYVTATGQRVVIVRIFVKKTQKTPQRELELARQRAKEVK